MRIIQAENKLTDEQADALGGTFAQDSHYDILIRGEDVTVLKPDGTPLLIFLHRALLAEHGKAAYENLRNAAVQTDNRGMAAGVITSQADITQNDIGRKSRTRYWALKKGDKAISNTQRARVVNSGIIGFIDRAMRHPYCRTTAYNVNNPERFAAAMPFIRAVDGTFARYAPDRYAAQMAMVQQTAPDWVITGTAFTTITVNMNFRTAYHKDKGDYAGGFGVMTALRAGWYDGCYLTFPKYGVATDLHSGDVLLADVHEWHGNTAFKRRRGQPYERLSMVFYYRNNMRFCGTAEQELELVKRRKPGDALNWDAMEALGINPDDAMGGE